MMDAQAEHAVPLPALWVDVSTRFQNIENTSKSSVDPELQAQVRDAIKAAEGLLAKIQSAGLISSNEEAEDIPTKNLKYFLLHFYLGMLELKLVDGERLVHCTNAKRLLTAFIHNCDISRLIDKDDLKAVHNEFTDPGQRRQDLIARSKRDQAAKARLEEIVRLKRARLAAKGAEKVEEDEDNDDELERQNMLLGIHMSVRQALKELDLTNRELEMLDASAKGPPSKPPASPARAPAPKPAAKAAAPPRPSAALSQQQAMAKTDRISLIRFICNPDAIIADVFKPGWTQPTYSVEEAVEFDIASGKIVMDDDKKAPKQKKDSDDEEDDEELKKKRDWDDWKDTHPAGSGNRLRQG